MYWPVVIGSDLFLSGAAFQQIKYKEMILYTSVKWVVIHYCTAHLSLQVPTLRTADAMQKV